MRKLLAGLMTACGLCVSSGQGALAQEKTVAIGQWPPLGTYWPNVIAEKKDLYAAEKLKASIYYIGDPTGIIQQVMGGSLNIGFPTCEAAIRAIDKGAEITIIGQTMKVYPFLIVGAKDIKSAADLKGKKMMGAGLKSILTVVGNEWLQSQGVKLSDVDIVHDGSTPNRYAALVNGVVSATVLSQPFDFRALAEGNTKLFDYAANVGEYAFVCAIASKAWLKTNQDTAKMALRAVSRATDWWYDPSNKAEAIDILAAATKLDSSLVAKTYDYYHEIGAFNKGLVVSKPSVEKTLAILKKNGDIGAGTTYEKVVDTSFGN